jgi:hypothetical protein
MTVAASIEGRTVDETGEPIAGVDLEVRIDGGSLVTGDSTQVWSLDPARHFGYAMSGDDGRFRLGWLRPGTARLSFDVACRLPASRDGIVLAAGTVAELEDVVLERGPTIRGRVIDEDGHPFASAEVRISVHDFEWDDVEHPIHSELQIARWGRLVHTATYIGEREGRYGVTRTGDDGTFVLGGLTGGEYGIYATGEGWEPACVLHVATGSDGVCLQLRRQGRLLLRLVDDVAGTPVSDATLTVTRGTGTWFRDEESLPVTAAVDGPGRFFLDAVCPAPMAVVSESKSHGRQVARIEGLALGAPLEEREVRVPLGATIAGRVVDGAGAPLPGATVRLAPYSHDQALGLLPVELFATAGAEGRFEFGGVTPARWSLGAQLTDYRVSGARERDVVVGAGETRSGIELVMTRTGRVQGVVRDADGRAAPDLMVVAQEDERSGIAEGVTRTDAGGHYAMEVRPGTYALLVSLANSSDTVRRTIQVSADETVGLTSRCRLPRCCRAACSPRACPAPTPPCRCGARTSTERGRPTSMASTVSSCPVEARATCGHVRREVA